MERQEKDLQSILGQILKREGGGVGGSTAGTGSPRPVVIGRHVDHSHRPLIDNLTTSQRSVHSVSSITGRARTQIYASVCQCFSLSRGLFPAQPVYSGAAESSVFWFVSFPVPHRLPACMWLKSDSGSSWSLGELLEWILPISSRALARESRSAVSWWRASHRLSMTADGLCCFAK